MNVNKDSKFYKKNLNLTPVRCNGFLNVPYTHGNDFDFAYYMLESGLICPLHEMFSLETCHYVAGDPMQVVTVSKSGRVEYTTLGPDLHSGHTLHLFIQPETISAFFLDVASSWSLISHFNFPSYEEEMTTYYTQDMFLKKHPSLVEIAQRFEWDGFYNQNCAKERNDMLL